ncbi:hypothetical protein M0R04_07395 [Candidatus Dojkabacteria bacterium]|jgi:peptidoglycan hydrolase CwlO-like protein|nr:hypothetical protein [Candidatus Dojkabacteria bacterium]
MITDAQFKKMEKDIQQLKVAFNNLLRHTQLLQKENNRLKHEVHRHSNEIASLGRK